MSARLPTASSRDGNNIPITFLVGSLLGEHSGPPVQGAGRCQLATYVIRYTVTVGLDSAPSTVTSKPPSPISSAPLSVEESEAPSANAKPFGKLAKVRL